MWLFSEAAAAALTPLTRPEPAGGSTRGVTWRAGYMLQA
jgi:hypothetical protein